MSNDKLRGLANEALAWMESSVTDRPDSLCRDLRAALSEPASEPVGYGLQKPDGSIDHDLVGSKADCEFWSRAEKEPQSGWTVVPLYLATPTQSARDALALAIRFHETYERLAPNFGYETRPDTKVFDQKSKNGRLMVAVCAALATPTQSTKPVGCETVTVPVWKLERAATVLNEVGDQTGIAADLEAMLKEAAKPEHGRSMAHAELLKASAEELARLRALSEPASEPTNPLTASALTDAGRIAASIGLGIFPEKCSDEEAVRWLAEKEASYGNKEALRDLGTLEACLGGSNGPSIKLRSFLERRALATPTQSASEPVWISDARATPTSADPAERQALADAIQAPDGSFPHLSDDARRRAAALLRGNLQPRRPAVVSQGGVR